MVELDIPGWRRLRLETLVSDLNGTLAVDGRLEPIQQTMGELARQIDVVILSADTHGTLDRAAKALGVRAVRLRPGGQESEQKADFVRQLGPDRVVALGNGANDKGMLELAALSIVVLGREGAAPTSLMAGDLVVGSARSALQLLTLPTRLVASLRR